jgi:Cu2+-exporting ATPase
VTLPSVPAPFPSAMPPLPLPARELDLPFCEVRGGVGPEEKLAAVERARLGGPVFMVGDGVNDAGALSAASVGIAVHGGAEASLSAADIFLTRPGVGSVLELVLGARRTLRVISRNLAFSLVYNVIGVALAITGLIGPLIAAVLMPLSSLTVVTSSFRARTFGGRP